MSKSSFSSHVPWQGSTRLSTGGAVLGRDATPPQRQPHPGRTEQVFVDRVTNALHMMQDHLHQTTVISQRRLQKTRCKQSASKTQAMLPTTPWRPLLKHANDQKRREVRLLAEVPGGRRDRDNVQRRHPGRR